MLGNCTNKRIQRKLPKFQNTTNSEEEKFQKNLLEKVERQDNLVRESMQRSQVIEINFHKFIQKSPIISRKIVTKTVYIGKLIKLFRFHMNPQKAFPL